MKLLMKKALNELTNLQSGEFLLKDLFKGYEWNRLDRNIRLKLGLNNFKPSVPANVYSKIYISNSGECLRTTPKGIGCVRFSF